MRIHYISAGSTIEVVVGIANYIGGKSVDLFIQFSAAVAAGKIIH